MLPERCNSCATASIGLKENEIPLNAPCLAKVDAETVTQPAYNEVAHQIPRAMESSGGRLAEVSRCGNKCSLLVVGKASKLLLTCLFSSKELHEWPGYPWTCAWRSGCPYSFAWMVKGNGHRDGASLPVTERARSSQPSWRRW